MSDDDEDRYCPEIIDMLGTGDTIACGRFATVQGDDGIWRCYKHHVARQVLEYIPEQQFPLSGRPGGFTLSELPELPQITTGEYQMRVQGGFVIIKVQFIPDVKS